MSILQKELDSKVKNLNSKIEESKLNANLNRKLAE